MFHFQSLWRMTALAIAIGGAASSAAAELKSPKTWFSSDDNRPQLPNSVVAVWSPAILERADGSRARGFGGRLMFYGKTHSTIRVDGPLVVYAYDDGRNPQDSRPSRKYVFTREQFATHYSKSELGHTYSIWIPWDHVEATTKQISLVVRFNPMEGSPVLSEMAKATLPGGNAPPIVQRAPEGDPPGEVRPAGAVQAVAHEVPVREEGAQQDRPSESNRQMATATIRIPPRNERR